MGDGFRKNSVGGAISAKTTGDASIARTELKFADWLKEE